MAWDLDREHWRTFRVDRLRPRIPLGRRFAPRALPETDAGAYVLRRVRELWEQKAVVLVHAPAGSDVMRRWATIGEVSAVDAAALRFRRDREASTGRARATTVRLEM